MIDDLIAQIQTENIHSVEDLFDIFWAIIFNQSSDNISGDLEELSRRITHLHTTKYLSDEALKVLSGFIQIAQEYILQNGEPYAIEEDPYSSEQ